MQHHEYSLGLQSHPEKKSSLLSRVNNPLEKVFGRFRGVAIQKTVFPLLHYKSRGVAILQMWECLKNYIISYIKDTLKNK